ncbi:MAG: PTH1 family peptidyl-tRNA hydrolase [Francisellaceae bacterium]|jgi:PTH1 family peptidyl-tRNA hydrolase
MSAIKLIVGLGNPGEKYANTRHNAGVWFTTLLAEKYSVNLKSETKFSGYTARINTPTMNCFLLRPTTYMNISGLSVHQICTFYKIKPNEILICHDEIDLPCGSIRLKFSGGHGGHNGLRNIQSQIGKDFHRLRIGVDRPNHQSEVVNYVLNSPQKDQSIEIEHALLKALDFSEDIILGKFPQVMNKLHRE